MSPFTKTECPRVHVGATEHFSMGVKGTRRAWRLLK